MLLKVAKYLSIIYKQFRSPRIPFRKNLCGILVKFGSSKVKKYMKDVLKASKPFKSFTSLSICSDDVALSL